jgi:hypothetical protein
MDKSLDASYLANKPGVVVHPLPDKRHSFDDKKVGQMGDAVNKRKKMAERVDAKDAGPWVSVFQRPFKG